MRTNCRKAVLFALLLGAPALVAPVLAGEPPGAVSAIKADATSVERVATGAPKNLVPSASNAAVGTWSGPIRQPAKPHRQHVPTPATK